MIILAQWVLLVTYGAYGIVPIYFDSEQLCKQAERVINDTKGNGTYANTPCLRVGEDG